MALFTVVLGVVYTLAITGVGQLIAPWQANGSTVRDAAGDVVGSALLGQGFQDADGNPLPEYFQPRPSAEGWTGTNSYGSNYGPENQDLIDSIGALKAQIAEFDGVGEDEVPADAVTASGSGPRPRHQPRVRGHPDRPSREGARARDRDRQRARRAAQRRAGISDSSASPA